MAKNGSQVSHLSRLVLAQLSAFEATMPKRRLCWQCVLADRHWWLWFWFSFIWLGWEKSVKNVVPNVWFYHPKQPGSRFFLKGCPLCYHGLLWCGRFDCRAFGGLLRGNSGKRWGNLLNDVGKWWQTSLFFWWWNHESWCFWSKIYWFFWSTSYGFSFKSLVKLCRTVAGEFCGNGRNFFQKLSDRSDLALNDMSLVFETRNVMIFWFADDKTWWIFPNLLSLKHHHFRKEGCWRWEIFIWMFI